MAAYQSTSNHNQIHIPYGRKHAHEPSVHSPQNPANHTDPLGPMFSPSSHIRRQPVSSETSVSMGIIKYVTEHEAKHTNLVFSPLSIELLLGLVAAGATGQTRDQIISFLNCGSIKKLILLAIELRSKVLVDGSAYGGPKLCFASGVWVDNKLPLKPIFMQIASNDYKAACKNVDFQTKATEAAREVNLWVENSTKGLIKDILPPGSVHGNTRLILANALYFKGVWKQKFDRTRTRDSEFYLLNEGSVKAAFMSSTAKQYVCAFDELKVLRLCYAQGKDNRQFSMYIFLPNARGGLHGLIQKANSRSGFFEQHLPSRLVEVGLCMIPRFKISFAFDASQTLKQLGLTFPFSEGGLTEMVDSPLGANLFVSNIFHKSFIEVNEEGTEAAAATAATVTLKSIDLTPKFDFVADHPFLFFIREDTSGTLLFIGHVLNPLSQH